MNRLSKYCIIYIIILFGGAFLNVFANMEDSVHVKVALRNAYQGSLSFIDEYYSDGTMLYTSQIEHPVSVSADTTTDYTISGDITIGIPGSGNNIYDNTEIIRLDSTSEGVKTLHAEFINDENEWVKTQEIQIFYDITPPTQPVILSPFMGDSIDDAGILFQRSQSSDTDAGVSHYRIVASTTPNMLNPIIFETEQTSLLVSKNLLPKAKLYRYVEVIDNVGNSTQSLPSYFVHKKSPSGKKPSRKKSKSKKSGERVVGNTLYEDDTPHIDTEKIPKDDGLTYYFTGFEKETSILEIIRENNRLNVLINKIDRESPHEHGTSLIIYGEEANVNAGFILPDYLQKTGANVSELYKHLSLIQKYFPNTEIKQEMKKILSLLLPKWYAGMFIVMLLVCYDIEYYKRWYLSFFKENYGQKDKNVLLYGHF